MSCVIDEMTSAHWESVRAIYLEGITTGTATFETQAPVWESWDAAHLPHSRFVVRAGETIGGWAALSAVSSRCVYGGVAEVSVYVANQVRGGGIGRALLAALIESARAGGLWTLQASIFPENEASLALHRSLGFREVGFRERVGRLDGAWRDVLLLELRL